MKRFANLFMIGLLAGGVTLGAYKYFFEAPIKVVATEEAQPNMVQTSFNYPPPNTTKAAIEGIDFTGAAEATVNAVVHVKNTSVSSGPATISDFFFGRSRPQARIGTGSGVFISSDGFIITNNHVIADAQELEVTTNDNKTYKAEVVGTDPKTDIAILKVEANQDFPSITFGDSDGAKIGEWVLAVGNPFNLTSTVTAGIISAKSRDINPADGINQSYIQTDAAVNRGNSGGALVNVRGELIGINTAITSETGSYVGYSFAVPSNIAKKVMEDIIEYGNVQEGMLGVSGTGLNSTAAEELNISETQGFYIGGVEEGSGAEKAGLREGDVIKRIDGVSINKFSDMAGYLKSKRPNDKVNVTVLRKGNYKTIPVRLTKRAIANLYGMQVKNITSSDKNKFKINGGVKVNSNQNRSFARIGITEGYVITHINDIEVNSIDDVNQFLNSKKDLYKLVVINTDGEVERYIFE